MATSVSSWTTANRSIPHAIRRATSSYAQEKSARRWRDARIAAHFPGIGLSGQGYVTKGINTAMKPPRACDALAPYWVGGGASALRSAVSSGQWPQIRLKKAGLAQDDMCQLCHEQKGTLSHRRVCTATRHMRGPAAVPQHLRATYDALTDQQTANGSNTTWVVCHGGVCAPLNAEVSTLI